MTKSHPKSNTTKNNQVYEWIASLQKDPNDEALKEKLVLHYEGLVHSLAKKYSYNRSNHQDLAQVAMIGLLRSSDRFDRYYGKTFAAFNIHSIIGEIKRFIHNKTWSVHVPRRTKALGPKIIRVVDELTGSNQHSPTLKEIAAYLNVSEE